MSLCIVLRNPNGGVMMAADTAVSTEIKNKPYRVVDKQMERINVLSKAFEGMTPQTISPIQVLPGIVRVDGGSSIHNITHNKPVEISFGDTNITATSDKAPVIAKYVERITEKNVNEIARILRVTR